MNPLFLLISSILLAWCLGLYQSFIAVYILGVFSILTIQNNSYSKNSNSTTPVGKKSLMDVMHLAIRMIFCLSVGLVLCFIANKMIQRIFHITPSDYLWNNIKWFDRLLLRLVVATSPFIFPILFGNGILMRIQIVFPLAVAIESAIIIEDLSHIKRTGNAATIITASLLMIFSMRNAQALNQAFQTGYISYNYDVQTCYDINNEIQRLMCLMV